MDAPQGADLYPAAIPGPYREKNSEERGDAAAGKHDAVMSHVRFAFFLPGGLKFLWNEAQSCFLADTGRAFTSVEGAVNERMSDLSRQKVTNRESMQSRRLEGTPPQGENTSLMKILLINPLWTKPGILPTNLAELASPFERAVMEHI